MSEEGTDTTTDTSGTDATAAATASWRDSLEPDLRGNPSLAKFEDVPALAKSYVEAQKVIGKKGIILPGENATQEEMDQFYGAIGRPDSVDGYELDDWAPPEGIADIWNSQGMEKMVEKMHARGVPKAMLRGILDDFAEHQAETFSPIMQSIEDGKNGATRALKEKWGLACDAKIDMAKRAVGAAAEAIGLTKDDVNGIVLPDGQLLGNSPVLTEIFAFLGEKGGEMAFLGDSKGGSRSTLTPQEAEAEIKRLQASEAYTSKKHPEHKQVIDRLSALHQMQYPDEG